MAFWVYPTGHDMQNRLNNDSLGQLYLILASTWTFLLLCGMAFLIRNRKLPFLRMRRLPLGILAVASLHVYWVLCMLAYILNGYFACSMEYWIMSTYLPFGIALYQASNTQLLHVAGLQKQFTSPDLACLQKHSITNLRGWRRLLAKWNSYSPTRRTLLGICMGMTAQIISTIIIYMLSRRFHSSWGLVGHGVNAMQCRKGWEWWPSIAWQFTWTWIYAPYLVWQVRKVHDLHGWRQQTIVCSFAGLLGSPMWLLALSSPRMGDIDKYWVPPLWFTPGIMVMEGSIILVPCWQVIKSRRLRQETLEILAEWEVKRSYGGSNGSDSSRTAIQRSPTKTSSSARSASSRHGEMYTMAALEKALHTNPLPLLTFAALRDFSGENISFLSHIRDWKAVWQLPANRFPLFRKPLVDPTPDKDLRARQFQKAVQIYASLVGIKYSEYPVNLSFAHRKELDIMFEDAASRVSAEVQGESATPFDDLETASAHDLVSHASTYLNGSQEQIFSCLSGNHRHTSVGLREFPAPFSAENNIPAMFGPDAFDHAEESVKYMVLTNTWPKFVATGHASSREHKAILQRAQKMLEPTTHLMARALGFAI